MGTAVWNIQMDILYDIAIWCARSGRHDERKCWRFDRSMVNKKGFRMDCIRMEKRVRENGEAGLGVD